MIWLTQTSTTADTPRYFSTERTETPVIKKTGLNAAGDFCTCVVQCVPDLKVFTDGLGADPLKNDWTSFFIKTVNQYVPSTSVGSTVTGTIKNLTTGESNTLVDTTYGDLEVGNFFYWYKIDWFKVWGEMGLGRYQITIVEEGTSGNQKINEFESVFYNLCSYSARAANGTVRIYSKQQGKLHHGNDYSNLITTANTTPFPYEQQTRLPGRLVSLSPEEEDDYLVLNNGNRSSLQVKAQLRPKFKLDLYLLSSKQINKVVFDELFGQEVLVTDYNVYNHVNDPRDFYANQYIDIPVLRTSTDVPNPRGTAIRRTYSIALDYDFDNVFKTNN